MILYKDPKLIKTMMWITLFVLITSNVYKGRVKGMMEFVSSANGFAFVCRDEFFANAKGKNLLVDVRDFRILNSKPLEGCIIRSSNNDGEYVVGCRMPHDSDAIRDYVSQNYSE